MIGLNYLEKKVGHRACLRVNKHSFPGELRLIVNLVSLLRARAVSARK